MRFGNIGLPALLAAGSTVTLAAATLAPGAALAGATDPDLLALVELPDGNIEYEMELGTLHFFD